MAIFGFGREWVQLEGHRLVNNRPDHPWSTRRYVEAISWPVGTVLVLLVL